MVEPNAADNPRSLAWVVNAVKGWVERCGAIWVQAQVIEITRRSSPTQFLTPVSYTHLTLPTICSV